MVVMVVIVILVSDVGYIFNLKQLTLMLLMATFGNTKTILKNDRNPGK